MALLVGGWTENRQQEFFMVAEKVLRNDPGELVLPALAKAIRVCRFASELIPFVSEEISGLANTRRMMLGYVQGLERCAALADNR